MFIIRCIVVWTLVLAATVHAGDPVRREIGGVSYWMMQAELAKLRMVWKDDAGKPLRTFAAAIETVKARGEKPLFLMNAGIFEPGGVPSGLYVEKGKTLRPLNLQPGEGNFFLKPNGVFLWNEKAAAVVESSKYSAKHVSYAVQSGPLLMQRGIVHPAFRAESKNFLHRNGVGVTKDGKVIFLMSDWRSPRWPNLHAFAEAFRSLGCDDALFLDGDISQMQSGENLGKGSQNFGAMLIVVE